MQFEIQDCFYPVIFTKDCTAKLLLGFGPASPAPLTRIHDVINGRSITSQAPNVSVQIVNKN